MLVSVSARIRRFGVLDEMGWFWRKSKKVGPVRVNLSQRGVGWSFGSRWFRFGQSADGRSYTSRSIPGTGLRSVTYGAAGCGCGTLIALMMLGMGGCLAIALLTSRKPTKTDGPARAIPQQQTAPRIEKPAQTPEVVPPKKTSSIEFDPKKRLQQAKQYLPTAPDVAKRWLREIVEKHPQSEEAKEARLLLNSRP